MWHISHNFSYKRLASLAIAVFSILSFAPKYAISSENSNLICEILYQGESGNSDNLAMKFNEIEQQVNEAQDPREEGRKFLRTFIQEINIRYNLNLTVSDACTLVRENIGNLHVSAEDKEFILKSTSLIELDFEDKVLKNNVLYWPNEWNWFGLNKKEKDKTPNKNIQSPPLIQTELPGNCYMGA